MRGLSITSALRKLIEERSRTYYAKDADAPARWEPDGADFFSPSLMEADLMRRVLPAEEFRGLVQGLPAGHREGGAEDACSCRRR